MCCSFRYDVNIQARPLAGAEYSDVKIPFFYEAPTGDAYLAET